MKQFLTLFFVFFLNVAFSAPIQVALEIPGGLKVGKNQISAQVQADASYNGTPLVLVVDPGNSQAVQEITLGKLGDSSLGGEIDLTSLNAAPSLTVKVSPPQARYAATQVLAANASRAAFTLEAPRTSNRTPFVFVAGLFAVFAALGAMALRGKSTAF